MASLFWHVFDARPESVTREAVGEAVLGRGLTGATPVLKLVLRQISLGRYVGRLAVASGPNPGSSPKGEVLFCRPLLRLPGMAVLLMVWCPSEFWWVSQGVLP